MRAIQLRIGFAVCAVLALAGSSWAIDAHFQGLGDLPGGNFFSAAAAISADGSTVVGHSNSANGVEAFRWTFNNGMLGLGDLSGGSFGSQAFAVSGDGSVIVGKGQSDADGVGTDVREAFRWEANVIVGLGDLPGNGFDSVALGVSGDGSVVVGNSTSFSASGEEAFHWNSNDGVQGLGDLDGGGFQSVAVDITPDASIIIGRASSTGVEAVRWVNGSIDGIGKLTGGDNSFANAVSADGSVIVGESASSRASPVEAFRWTNSAGMVGLGDLPGGSFFSDALDVSADGLVIVGFGHSASGSEAFIWDHANGIRSIQSVLANGLGLDLTGWALNRATGVSADGLTVVGIGINPSGQTEGWVAVLPEPSSVGAMLVGILGMMRRRR